MNPRARPLPEFGGLDQGMTTGAYAGKQTIRSLRLLGGPLDHAPHQKKLRIVTAVKLAIDSLQEIFPVFGPYRSQMMSLRIFVFDANRYRWLATR
jgi:hypothetical protein